MSDLCEIFNEGQQSVFHLTTLFSIQITYNLEIEIVLQKVEKLFEKKMMGILNKHDFKTRMTTSISSLAQIYLTCLEHKQANKVTYRVDAN